MTLVAHFINSFMISYLKETAKIDTCRQGPVLRQASAAFAQACPASFAERPAGAVITECRPQSTSPLQRFRTSAWTAWRPAPASKETARTLCTLNPPPMASGRCMNLFQNSGFLRTSELPSADKTEASLSPDILRHCVTQAGTLSKMSRTIAKVLV